MLVARKRSLYRSTACRCMSPSLCLTCKLQPRSARSSLWFLLAITCVVGPIRTCCVYSIFFGVLLETNLWSNLREPRKICTAMQPNTLWCSFRFPLNPPKGYFSHTNTHPPARPPTHTQTDTPTPHSPTRAHLRSLQDQLQEQFVTRKGFALSSDAPGELQEASSLFKSALQKAPCLYTEIRFDGTSELGV